jgi:Isoprenylcysteine carboxyl methyltransferase (ICMT) family
MGLSDLIGAPQIAALLVLMQRGLEELYSARNTRHLLAEGGREVGSVYYPVVAATHLAWIASLFFLISPQAPIVWPLVGYYLALQIVRYWVIASLGRFWTHRIITLADAPIARSGPYQLCGDHCRDVRLAARLRRHRACRHHDRAVVDRDQHQDETRGRGACVPPLEHDPEKWEPVFRQDHA